MLARVRPRSRIHQHHWLTIAVLISILSGCAGGSRTGGYNPTTPLNNFDQATIDAANLKTLVITNVNLGSPSRKYLQRQEARVDAMVTEVLEQAGYRILPAREFSQRWNNAILTYGNPIDPTTNRVNSSSFVQIIQSVREQMIEQTDVDGFVFTDLQEKDVTFTQGVNRVARWDGVTRKPSLQGPGQGVTGEFDWNRPVAAASIRVVVFDSELNKVYDGVGGMDLTDAVDTRSGLDFVRRKEILPNDNFINEGISLALHPWIPMTNWPGDAPEPQ